MGDPGMPVMAGLLAVPVAVLLFVVVLVVMGHRWAVAAPYAEEPVPEPRTLGGYEDRWEVEIPTRPDLTAIEAPTERPALSPAARGDRYALPPAREDRYAPAREDRYAPPAAREDRYALPPVGDDRRPYALPQALPLPPAAQEERHTQPAPERTVPSPPRPAYGSLARERHGSAESGQRIRYGSPEVDPYGHAALDPYARPVEDEPERPAEDRFPYGPYRYQ